MQSLWYLDHILNSRKKVILYYLSQEAKFRCDAAFRAHSPRLKYDLRWVKLQIIWWVKYDLAEAWYLWS